MHRKKIPVFVIDQEDALPHLFLRDVRGEFDCIPLSTFAELPRRIRQVHMPAVVIVNLSLGEDALVSFLQTHPPHTLRSAVIAIAEQQEQVQLDRLLAYGVEDYILKDEFTFEELAAKIKRAEAGIAGGVPTGDSHLTSHTMTQRASINPTDIRVLIIEDDQFLRDLSSRKLQQEGFHVDVAIDGNEGLKKIVQNKPDVILLDIILPGIDGFDILKRVRGHEQEAVRTSTVILLSNLGQEADVAKGERLGADDYLIKANFTIDEIISKIHAALEKKRSGKVA